MRHYLDKRPAQLYIALVLGLLLFGAIARPAVQSVLPDLSIMGLRVTINWLFVVLVVGLVALLGWWGKIRLTAPIAAGGQRYLLVLAALIAVPMLVTVLLVPDPFAVPDWTFLEGQELSAAAVALMIVVGLALGAAISEEFLYRGVVLRSLESYGRVTAAVASSVLFGVAHLSLLAVGVSLTEVLVVAALSMVVFFGLAAITFRIGTLWPLVVWHFLQDSGPAFLTAQAVEVYLVVNVLFAIGLAILGAWLLWTDRDHPVVENSQAEQPSRPA
jgi:membrane protease YdiL (CAAX protease family)